MDIKLVEHAKDYIYDLANGINPFTKEDVNSDDIVNNVKISRCLFYVSSVLDEVIKNGRVNKTRKQPTSEFCADALEHSKISYSQAPVTISTIVDMINELRPDGMKKLKVTAVTNWLVDIKMLEVVVVNNKNQKRPTAEGNILGITEERRQGQYGVYYTVLYNENAQHFIIDNLQAIIDGGYN